MKWSDIKAEVKLPSEEKTYLELVADIVTIRINKDLTQSDLADMTGLHQSAIARFETPFNNTSNVLTLIKILDALDIDLTLTPRKETVWTEQCQINPPKK
jgi:transcriptional regulator with XRE-family HTH domain